MVFSHKSNYYFRFTLDIFLLGLSFIVTHHFSFKSDFQLYSKDLLLLLSLCILWFFCARNTKLYSGFRSLNFSYELIAVIKCVSFHAVWALILVFLFFKDYLTPRYFIPFYALSLLVSTALVKYVLKKFLYKLRVKGRNLRHVLIVGAGEVGQRFHDTIVINKHFGYDFIGFLDDNKKPNLNGHYLGKIEELDHILSTHRVDEVIMALPNYAMSRVEEAINVCENHTVRVRIIPDYFKFVSNKFQVTNFGSFPIISVRTLPLDEAHNKMFKYVLDVIISLFAFAFLFSWLFPVVAVLIKLSSRGPVFFKQERWGINNRKIICYKFRSMVTQSRDVDEKGNYQQAQKNDPRITRLGRFLRKSNIDELPQFWNVLKGDMSIVGPRPHPIPLNMESKNSVNRYMLRHLVKPGITGWAQVNGYRGETSKPYMMQKRVEYDIWYIENWSFWLDLQIMILTVWNMVKGDKNAF
jgi:putative colanic acid biosysnthesis UDP-glucose lipid carrier transferase